jgi:hypothetical protein
VDRFSGEEGCDRVDEERSAGFEDQVRIEQEIVDRVYARLDGIREGYRSNLREVNASHGVGTGQGDRERDVIASHFGELIERLGLVEERLVFGRLDPREGGSRYIGRIGISDEGGAPLLIDWRAPAGRAFYQATAAHPEGIARRRHIATRRRVVTGLEDELLDTDSAREQGLELQGEGALMSALSQAREGRMTDIVSTIQAEQDRVIRAPGRGLLVVEGGPGTGKTAVALHRAAFLLYAERERLERSGVLIVGPSRVFLRYIEQVLPSLGESGVVATTLGDLVPGVHAGAVDPEDVDRAKGDPAWAGILAAAVRDLERVPDRDQVLDIGGHPVTLAVSDVAAARTRARRSGKPHNVARESFALGLVDLLVQRVLTEAADEDDAAQVQRDPEELQLWRQEVRESVDARRAINLAWMPTSGTALLERLYARPDRLARLNASASPRLSAEQLALVARPKGAPLTVSDIPLVDELEELLGPSAAVGAREAAERTRRRDLELGRAQATLEDMGLEDSPVTADALAATVEEARTVAPLAERAAGDRSWTYGHIIVDEAQELSPMAWRALLRRCPSLSLTVVGDLDQRRGHRRPRTWRAALGPAARALADEKVLSISYRTPATLIRLAERTMADVGDPVRHPVRAVRDVPDAYALTRVPGGVREAAPREKDPMWGYVQRVLVEEARRLDATAGTGRGRLAVVVATRRAGAWGADSVGYSGLDQRVSLLSAVSVKGLEFDDVILVEPSEILEDGTGDLFVAMTRSTRRLHVVAAGTLPSAMDTDDPQIRALAR